MTELEFFSKNPFFTTRDFALNLNIGNDSASRKLNRLSLNVGIEKVSRGIWAYTFHKHYSVYGAIPYLLGPEQGYLSFLSALHYYGLISQIPTKIQVATTGHGRSLKSAIGNFEFFQINPRLMQEGSQAMESQLFYNIASPEKALLDTFYIATKKTRRFLKMPELELINFNEKKFLKLLKSYPRVSQKLIWKRYLTIRE